MTVRIINSKRIFFDVSHPQFLALLEVTDSGFVLRTYRDKTDQLRTDKISLAVAKDLILVRRGGVYSLNDGSRYIPKLTISRPA